MFIAPVKRGRARAFTLLEIALAMAILGMMATVIFRFVSTTMTILRVSSEENAADASYAGLVNLVTAQLQELPSGVGALSGEPFKFGERPRDEMTWICSSGPGLLTRYAPGEFIVRMRLQRVNDKSDQMEIGLLRKPRDTAEGSTEGESWVSVLEGVRSLEVRYFDPRLNAWTDRWTDPAMLPRLVKLVVGRADRGTWEAIIPLGRTSQILVP